MGYMSKDVDYGFSQAKNLFDSNISGFGQKLGSL